MKTAVWVYGLCVAAVLFSFMATRHAEQLKGGWSLAADPRGLLLAHAGKPVVRWNDTVMQVAGDLQASVSGDLTMARIGNVSAQRVTGGDACSDDTPPWCTRADALRVSSQFGHRGCPDPTANAKDGSQCSGPANPVQWPCPAVGDVCVDVGGVSDSNYGGTVHCTSQQQRTAPGFAEDVDTAIPTCCNDTAGGFGCDYVPISGKQFWMRVPDKEKPVGPLGGVQRLVYQDFNANPNEGWFDEGDACHTKDGYFAAHTAIDGSHVDGDTACTNANCKDTLECQWVGSDNRQEWKQK